ncbi:hypothetical protein E3E35_08045 [Thermococcus sp. GR7]|uniref:hypothetical protein n=1 Tax=unclassified Thermococcus TaxID=2627626 RepID=UPI0014306423|nr:MULTISPECIES: hypothetical protein [unclassified Thermococcus]NJE47349.1 hypothetical protein [Thermococcus sp. GR7]NJE78844.1 hypothetical protein [Thermococcus sp. GR4]NJF23161.1 hypothetical protein [Thermococcus sp. GR5]
MTTMIATIDDVIDFLQKHKEKGYKYAIIAPDPVGGWSAPSRKRKYYQANFAVARDVFAKDDLMNLMNTAGFAVFLYKDTSLFDEDTKAYFEEADSASASSSSQEGRS